MISAATPAACGDDIDVPLIHTYRPPPLDDRPIGGDERFPLTTLVGARPAGQDSTAPEYRGSGLTCVTARGGDVDGGPVFRVARQFVHAGR